MDKTNEAGIDSGTGAGTDTGVDSASSAGSEQDNTDWQALYEKAEAEKENYKKAFTQKREFVKAGATDTEVDENEKPLTRADLHQAIAETVTPLVAQSKVDAELEKKVADPEKRKLVKLYYETRVRQMGTSDDAIRNDVEAAIAIADAQKLRNASAELTRKQNMQTSPPLSGSSADGDSKQKNHKFSPQQVAELTQRARSLNADPQKFIETAWKNQSK